MGVEQLPQNSFCNLDKITYMHKRIYNVEEKLMPKLARHTNELLSRLERILDIGCAEIRNYELLMWYEQDRVTVSIWRDIADRWEELTDESPLFVGRSDGVWVLVWGAGLTASDNAWLKDIRDLARRKSGDDTAEAA